MRVEAEIKEVSALHQGKNYMNGKAWKAMMVLLAWEDEEGANQAWTAMFNDVMDGFVQSGLSVGDKCCAGMYLSARSFRTGYHKTDISLTFIRRTTV